MNRLTLFIILALFVQYSVSAQSCRPDGITFSTQAEIDGFQTNYPNCTEIEGNVEISGDDIISLNGLSVLISIGGDLAIYSNNSLTSLIGMESLISLEGNLSIGIDVNLGIYLGNPVLINLTGFNNLSYIGGDLNILSNYSLTNLSGLESLTFITGSLWINGYDGSQSNLTSLAGLDNVTSIGGDLIIIENNALAELTGLNNVTSIDGRVQIWWNALISLSGLNKLKNINGPLSIAGNNSLKSLAGLQNISAVTIESLDINSNDSLSTCEVQSICAYLATQGGTFIMDNAPGCNSVEEVENACATVTVEEFQISDKLSIYPNPSSTQITIELPKAPQKNAMLIIQNMNYQQLLNEPITGKKTVIDLTDMPKGVYFVKVADDITMTIGKMVKN